MRKFVVLGSLLAGFVFGACGAFEDGGATNAPDGASDAAGGEAAVDAAPPVEASVPVPFCETDGGSLCQDFDDPGNTQLPLTNVGTEGTVGVVPDPHVSAPNALRATHTVPPDPTCRYAVRGTPAGLGIQALNGFSVEYKVRSVEAPLGRVRFGASVVVEEPDKSKYCSFYLGVENGAYTLFVEPGDQAINPQAIGLKRGIVPKEWSTVSFDVHGVPGELVVSVLIDGKEAITAGTEEDLITVCKGVGRITDVALGLLCVNSNAGGNLDMTFDDLRVIAH